MSDTLSCDYCNTTKDLKAFSNKYKSRAYLDTKRQIQRLCKACASAIYRHNQLQKKGKAR